MGRRRATTDRAHGQQVRDVLVHVREHADGELSLRELAKVAHASPYHLVRVFRERTGRRPGEHVRRVRLARAAEALRGTRRQVVRIALEAGYANHESFSRAFRAEFGMSPSEFRRRGKGRRTGMEWSVKLAKVPVTDFGRARAFYRDVMGMAEEFAVEEYGWGQYRAGAVPLCIYVVGGGGGDGRPGGERDFHLAVGDVRGAYEAIKARGARFACGVTASDDGSAFFVVEDPDGNQIKVGPAGE